MAREVAQTADPTPSTEDPYEQAVNNSAIQSKFAEVFAGSDDEEGEQPTPAARRAQRSRDEEEAEELEGLDTDEADDGTEPDDEPADEPDESDDAEEGSDESAEAEEQGQTDDDEAGEGEQPTLDPILRHAAHRAGWSDDEIDELAKASPDVAERQFRRVLDAYNDLSRRYGQFGQQPPQQQPPQPPRQQSQDAPSTEQDLLGRLYGGPEKVAELKEKYGPEMFDELLRPMLQPVQEMMGHYQAQQDQAVAREVNGFFGDLPETFGDLYGSNDKGFDEKQREMRLKVCEQADIIHDGAMRQGIDLPIRECLERANMMVAAEHLGSLERKRILSEARKRSKQRTRKPSQRGGSSGRDANKRSDKAAMEAYARRAKELGIDTSED